MKDFVGQELEIGDSVVLIAPKYRQFVVAEVIMFTPDKVKVFFRNTWNVSGDSWDTELFQYPDQLLNIQKVNIDIPFEG
jgi:hypothetical protein